MIDYLLDIDYVDHFAWLVVDGDKPGGGLAVARYVRDPATPIVAELAFGVVDRAQGKGLGTLLLGAIGVACSEAGIRTMVADVLEDNAPMRAVFAKAGAKTSFGERGLVHFEIDPIATGAILDEQIRKELQLAVHDIVTAATLALTAPG
jgi:RimJ/RimL family protein N-acetyltransferase